MQSLPSSWLRQYEIRLQVNKIVSYKVVYFPLKKKKKTQENGCLKLA